ncbi:hypothetical protein CEXT_737801 [Caerostris extrusa]|uniref:Uncharacterized protein n=1 Tax=Caerostris extrusa TaxID=172846 RepID=A0AAV4Y164_CAEEX|nr:hypothetical protein CEXT_737801 [Caerostris extrusa]
MSHTSPPGGRHLQLEQYDLLDYYKQIFELRFAAPFLSSDDDHEGDDGHGDHDNVCDVPDYDDHHDFNDDGTFASN